MTGGSILLSLTLLCVLISCTKCSKTPTRIFCDADEPTGASNWGIGLHNISSCVPDRYAVCTAGLHDCENERYTSHWYCLQSWNACKDELNGCYNGTRSDCWNCYRTKLEVKYNDIDSACTIDIPLYCNDTSMMNTGNNTASDAISSGNSVHYGSPIVLLGKKDGVVFVSYYDQFYNGRCEPPSWSEPEYWFFGPLFGGIGGVIGLVLILFAFGILACVRGKLCRSRCCIGLCGSCMD